MAAIRVLENVTITVDANTGQVTFEGKDGRTAGVKYMQSPGVSEDDVAFMYSEDEALQHINDANDTEAERYRDASLDEATKKGLM